MLMLMLIDMIIIKIFLLQLHFMIMVPFWYSDGDDLFYKKAIT